MYPLLAQLPKAPASLTTSLRTTLLAVGHVAAGDANAAVSAFQYIEQGQRDKAYELAILQTVPLIGIPRVLHSAAALQAAGVVGNASDSHDPTRAFTQTRAMMRDEGTKMFQQIYGRNSERVRNRLFTFHPALDEWIVSCAYGGLMQNQGAEISLRERELAIIAVLCGDAKASVQLASHLRGALKVGVCEQEVESVVQHTQCVFGHDAAQSAMATWMTYHRARYTL